MLEPVFCNNGAFGATATASLDGVGERWGGLMIAIPSSSVPSATLFLHAGFGVCGTPTTHTRVMAYQGDFF